MNIGGGYRVNEGKIGGADVSDHNTLWDILVRNKVVNQPIGIPRTPVTHAVHTSQFTMAKCLLVLDWKIDGATQKHR